MANTALDATVTDNSEVVTQGQTFVFSNTLTNNGSTWDITGATVTATVRRESAPDDALDATLEDVSVTIVSAAAGTVTWTITAAMSANLAAWTGNATKTIPHLCQYKVVISDTYYTRLLRFWVRAAID